MSNRMIFALLLGTLSCGRGQDMLEDDRRTAPVAAQLDVALMEWGIRLSADSVPAGPVRLHLSNVGTHNHQFEISEGSDGRKLAVVRIDAGKTRSIPLTLAPGHYAVRCGLKDSESTHWEWGMKADLHAFEAPK